MTSQVKNQGTQAAMVSAKDQSRLGRMLRDYEAGKLGGGVTKRLKGPRWWPGGGSMSHAKMQEASTTDTGLISVKLWDGSEVTGDAFDVYAWPDMRSSGTGRTGCDMEEFGPHIFVDEIWPIYKVGDDWFLGVSFTFFGKF